MNYNTNKKHSARILPVFEDTTPDEKSFNVIDTIALMHNLTLTKEQCRVMKFYLTKRKRILPPLRSCLRQGKS